MTTNIDSSTQQGTTVNSSTQRGKYSYYYFYMNMIIVKTVTKVTPQQHITSTIEHSPQRGTHKCFSFEYCCILMTYYIQIPAKSQFLKA